jgi:tetratricopeptide (TPR) repeat protein
MKLSTLTIILLSALRFSAFSQEYTIDLDLRNDMIDLFNKAKGYIKKDRTEEAYSILVRIIETDSVFREPYLYLYGIYIQKTDHTESTIRYLKKGLRIFKEDDEMMFYLGEIYRINSDMRNAISSFNLAIEYGKVNGEEFHLTKSYYFNRGNCYYRINEIDSAINDYTNTLRLDPGHSNALLNRGICYYRKAVITEACDDWNKSLSLGNANARQYIEKHCRNTAYFDPKTAP